MWIRLKMVQGETSYITVLWDTMVLNFGAYTGSN